MVKPSDISIHGHCMCLPTLEHSRLNLELRINLICEYVIPQIAKEIIDRFWETWAVCFE